MEICWRKIDAPQKGLSSKSLHLQMKKLHARIIPANTRNNLKCYFLILRMEKEST